MRRIRSPTGTLEPGWRSTLGDYYTKTNLAFSNSNIEPILPSPPEILRNIPLLINERIRAFPPPSPPPLLQDLNEDSFTNFSFDLHANALIVQNEDHSESVASLRFLEGLMANCVTKAKHFRAVIIEAQKYLAELRLEERSTLSLSPAEYQHIKLTWLPSLSGTKKSCIDLQNIDLKPVFSTEAIRHTLFSSKDELGFINLERRKSEEAFHMDSLILSIIDRANLLLSNIDKTVQCCTDLLKHYHAVVSFLRDVHEKAPNTVSRLDMIHVSWHSADLPSSLLSTRAANFAMYMRSLSLPVCSAVYAYLRSPRDFAYVLTFPLHYEFINQELQSIFSFLNLQLQLHEEVPQGTVGACAFFTL